MKKIFLYILLVTLVFNCKSDKKQITQDKSVKPKLNTFEKKLIDLRDVNQQFTSQLKVEKFGVQFTNDTTSSFVFKLDPLTEATIANSYSYGVRTFYNESHEAFHSNFSPNMRTIDGGKYIIVRNKLKDIYYLDSLYVFIYKRKNWKESGKLGDIKIRDILIEDENE